MKTRYKPCKLQSPASAPKAAPRLMQQPPPATSEELHRRLTERYRQLTEVPHAALARTA